MQYAAGRGFRTPYLSMEVRALASHVVVARAVVVLNDDDVAALHVVESLRFDLSVCEILRLNGPCTCAHVGEEPCEKSGRR